MTMGNTTEADIIAKMFNNTAIPWDGATQFDIHLHTADPGEAGTSLTNEATYTSYAVVTINRNAGALLCSGSVVSNVALLQFPLCTGGSNTITHGSITPAGSTQIIASGALSSSIPVSTNIRPQIEPGAMTFTLD